MARLWGDLQGEIKRALELQEKRAAADRQVATMTQDDADRMGSLTKWYPWLNPGVAYSMARAGFAALDNPLVQRVALQVLAAKERTAIGLGQVGDPVEEKDKGGGGLFGKITHAAGTGVGWATGYTPVKKGLTAAVSRDNPVGRFARDNPVTEHVLEPGMEQVFTGDNPLPRGLRAFSRNAAMIGDFPRQVAQGAYRSAPTDQDWAEAFSNASLRHPQRALHPLTQWAADIGPQTELGQTIQGIERRETSVDQGSGFFVGGQAKQRQHVAEQQYGAIIYPDGSRHARTIGRDMAGLFFEPGSDAYTATSGAADFIVAMGADKIVFGDPAAARRADRAFKAPGLGPRAAQAALEGREMTASERIIDTIGGIAAPNKRLTVDPNQIRNFLAGRGGNWFVDTIAETDSVRTLDRLSGGNWDPASLLALANETDPDVVRPMVEKLMTTGRVKDLPTTPMSRLGFTLRESAPEPLRLANQRMPKLGKEARHLRSPRESMTQFVREMDYLGIDETEQDSWLRKFADAPDTGIRDPELANKASATHRRAIFDEFDAHMQDVVAREVGMDDKGIAKARKLLQRENTRLASETNFFVNGGEPDSFFGLRTVDGEVLQPNTPTPLFINELQSEFMPSPNWREAKRQMSTIQKHFANGIEPTATAVRGMQNAWKGMVIFRPALLARVMGEIQMAMTLRGASTWFTHPLEMWSYVMGDSEAPNMLKRLKERGGTDISGRAWRGHADDAGEWVKGQERWTEVMGRSTFYRAPSDKFVLEHYPIANKLADTEDFYIGMADELHTIAKDPFGSLVVHNILQGRPVEESVGWAWNNMADERKILARSFDKQDGAKILTIDGTDAYIRKVHERVMQATGNGNEELMQALATGKLRDTPFDIEGVRNDELNKTLRDFADILPEDMRVPRELRSRAGPALRDRFKNLHGQALDMMFSNRERTLNRSPEMRQFYYKSAMSHASTLDPQYADEFIANLEKAGMKRNDIRTARYYATREVDNPLTLSELDDLAFAEATDEMQFFLEDLVDKKRWVEALSIMSPFAHVLTESMTRWGKILSNPNALAKVQRPLRGARDPELGDILHLNDDETDPERRGLMYKDANGEERVAIPLSAKMTGILGAPIPLQTRAQGYNMIGDFSPGVGPFATIGLAALSEKMDNPRYDALRQWIFPHGTPQGGIIERTVMGALPTWMRKALTDETPQQVIDAMYYKASTGDYNVQGEGATVDEINRLVNDSKQLAKVTKISNAVATMFSPSAPTPEWFIETEGGQRLPLLTVAKDIQQMRDDDPRNATLNALEKYGDNVFMLLVGKSIGVSPGVLPATVEAEKWIRSDGKGLRGKYKNTYGFFAPQEGDFSFDAYRRLLDTGDRKLNDPDDVPYIANDMVAKARYYAFRAKLSNPSEPRAAAMLRDFRAQLEKEYPGYDPDGPPGGTINKATTNSLIGELERAAGDTKNKTLQSHEAMPALKQYLAFRDKIQARAPKGRGEDWWTSSNDGRGMRSAAAQFGDSLAQENPAFAAMWEGALRREFEGALAKDDEINAAGGG
jgi:hypothetical protein